MSVIRNSKGQNDIQLDFGAIFDQIFCKFYSLFSLSQFILINTHCVHSVPYTYILVDTTDVMQYQGPTPKLGKWKQIKVTGKQIEIH